MKKLIQLLCVVLLLLSMVACGKTEEEEPVVEDNKQIETTTGDSEVKEAETKTETEPVVEKQSEKLEMVVEDVENGKKYTFSRMLTSLEDIQQLDITDEYQSACALIFTLAAYENDTETCFEMFEYINGPEDMSDYDKNFMKNQIDQYPYVMRSYFEGTSPENNYTVEEVSLTITENLYSRDEDGYVKLWFHSSGADSDRSVTLRKKGSTGEWFLFSDTYKGLMAGIRIPTSEDKWA